MNSQSVFGGVESTGVKLDIIREYISMYQKTVGNMHWAKTHYIDAFAGSGKIPLADTSTEGTFWEDAANDENSEFANSFIKGSTQIALEVEPSFSKFTFIEKDKDKLDELSSLLNEHPLSEKIDFRNGDANAEVRSICSQLRSKDRCVVFLDPFGSQVEWATIEAIAKTEAIDMWYLFPAGLSVFRQISRNGDIHHTHVDSISRIFGTDEWKEAFVTKKSTPDLFNPQAETKEKNVTPESAAEFMIQRLKTVFKGTVGDFKVPLGKHAYPSYYLLFASGNPSRAARSLTSKLSKAAVKAIEKKNGKPFGN